MKNIESFKVEYISHCTQFSQFVVLEENNDSTCPQYVTFWLSLIRKMTGGWDRKLVGAPASATEDSIAASDGRAVPLLVFIWAKVMPRSVLSLHNHIIVML